MSFIKNVLTSQTFNAIFYGTKNMIRFEVPVMIPLGDLVSLKIDTKTIVLIFRKKEELPQKLKLYYITKI